MPKTGSNSWNEKSDLIHELTGNQVSLLDIQICSEEDNNGFKILRLNAWNPLPSSKRDMVFEPSDQQQIGKSQLFNRVQMDCNMDRNYFQNVDAMRYFFAKRQYCANAGENKEVHYDPSDLNFPHIQYCITFLSQLKEHFLESNWSCDMNGSRVMIEIHHDSNNCMVKLDYMSKSTRKNKEGLNNDSFIHGLNNVIDILKVFMIPYNFKQSEMRKELFKATEKSKKEKRELEERMKKEKQEQEERKKKEKQELEQRKKLDRITQIRKELIQAVVKEQKEKQEIQERNDADRNEQQQTRKQKDASPAQYVDMVHLDDASTAPITPTTIQSESDELTQIDLELVSNSISEDEEITEWEYLITNVLDENQKWPQPKQQSLDQNQPPRKQQPLDKKQPPPKQQTLDTNGKFKLRSKPQNGFGSKYRKFFNDYKHQVAERMNIFLLS